ncbi:GL18421 [Drosophila persimilis]|uniref:GL18421 n=1 Tax=Drosophila persimilis TaxID=7234 RepID=B4HA55_DROPE|nr:GL18421 [Drosophila persimilis]
MVGVAADPSQADQLSSDKNPMIKYMLKTRENHAKEQDEDYSHVFRRKTRFEMFRLSAIAMAIEFAYAAETSFVSPILLSIGVDHKVMTMAWGLSPLIGFFVSPLLGSISDRCKLRWGRRRPIISILSFGIFCGLILVPYGKDLGVLLGDVGYNYTEVAVTNITNFVSEGSVAALVAASAEATGPSASDYKYAVILTILGMVMLDFDADTCQTPARTYLLDMCVPEEQPKAMTMFALFAGFGGTIGYAIGGVDWEMTHIGSFLGGNIPTVFGLVTIIFVICYIITVTTFREIPLPLMEQDELLRPMTDAAIKKELKKNNNAVYYIQETTQLELKMIVDDAKRAEALQGSYQNGYSPALEKNTRDLEGQSVAEAPVSLSAYLKSIFVMPYSMRMLALTNLLCWMGHVTYCLYFTDFVDESCVQWGSDGATNLRRRTFAMSTKAVYISGMIYYAIGMLILGLWPTKWGVLVFSTAAGILYGTIFTVPFILVARYHAKNCFRVRNGETLPLKQARGLGTDVAIISSVVFIAQLIVSVSVGPLVSWMGTTCAVLYASTVMAFLASIAAMFVLYV